MREASFDLAPVLGGSHDLLPTGDWLKRRPSELIRLRTSCPGFRELRAGLFELGTLLLDQPKLSRAVLVTHMPQVTPRRLAAEWESLKRLYRPEVVRRLWLVVFTAGGVWSPPGDQVLELLREDLHQEFRRQVGSRQAKLARVGWGAPRELPSERPGRLTPKILDILKVLLVHWFRGDGPVRISQIIDESGATYPTVREAVIRLEKTGELGRTSNRRVALPDFPGQSWPEWVALSRTLRRSLYLVDASGRPANPSGLLKRLHALRVPGLAVGGVVAARHWSRDFDLNGLPRIDATWHVADRNPDPDWIRRLDPALRSRNHPQESPQLVVHYLTRAQALFTPSGGAREILADPVETLLDLLDVRLIDQANAMIEEYRKKRRS